MKNIFTKFALFTLILIGGFAGHQHTSNAAWVEAVVTVPFPMQKYRSTAPMTSADFSPHAGIAMQDNIWWNNYNWSTTNTFKKKFELVRESGVFADKIFEIGEKEKLTIMHEPTTGISSVGGHPTHVMGGSVYPLIAKKIQTVHAGPEDSVNYLYYYSYGATPQDKGALKITSSNPDVMNCDSAGCVAENAGTATIKVEFENVDMVPDANMTMRHSALTTCAWDNGFVYHWAKRVPGIAEWWIDKVPDGYPRFTHLRDTRKDIIQKAFVDGNVDCDTTVSNHTNSFYNNINKGYGMVNLGGHAVGYYTMGHMKSVSYSYPAIEYTVTVTSDANTVPTVSNVTDNTQATSSTIGWTYTDDEGDPQQVYQVEISTDGNFDPLKSVMLLNGSGNSVHLVRSAHATDLLPDTQYHVRVRAQDNVNIGQWSNWAIGNFRTGKSGCDNSHTEGEVSCQANKEVKWTCNQDNESYSWKTVETGNSCSNAVSCQATPSSVDVTNTPQNVTFSVHAPKAGYTYAWEQYGESVGTTETSIVLKFTPKDKKRERLESVKVTATLNGVIVGTNSCNVTVFDGNSCVGNKDNSCGCPTAGGTVQCDGSCKDSAGTVVGPNCPLNTTQPVIIRYELNPHIANSSEVCPLFIEAHNVDSCELKHGGSIIGPFVSNSEGKVIVNGLPASVTPGSYPLTCIADGAVIPGGTRQCVSNLNLREF